MSLIPRCFAPDFLIMKDLTQGSLSSHVLTMAVPTFAVFLLLLVCGLVDLYFARALGRQLAMWSMSSALRGIGVVRPTMWVQALTVAINIMLAPVLVLGWGTGHPLGVAGAGLASSLAVAVGVIALWVYLRTAENY